jgi:bifunctional DNase/RNase
MEVEMKIRGLMMDPVTNMPIVVLKDVQGQAILPIWVGVYEANAIALEIEKVQTPRPMTHDLLKNVLLGLDVRVQKIVVNDLKDDTFFALIWVEREGQMMTIDSRPSDALALALRMDCPIFVDEVVLKNSKISSAFSEHQRATSLLARGPFRRRPRPLQDVAANTSSLIRVVKITNAPVPGRAHASSCGRCDARRRAGQYRSK